MTGPVVLSLDEVAVIEVTRLIQAGLLRPGRITQRGAIVHELTPSGIGAFEDFCRAPDAATELASCHEGECPSAEKTGEALAAWQGRGEDIGHLLDNLETESRKLSPRVRECIKGIRELLNEDSPK